MPKWVTVVCAILFMTGAALFTLDIVHATSRDQTAQTDYLYDELKLFQQQNVTFSVYVPGWGAAAGHRIILLGRDYMCVEAGQAAIHCIPLSSIVAITLDKGAQLPVKPEAR